MVLSPLKSPKVPSRLRGKGKGYALMYMSIEIADHLNQTKKIINPLNFILKDHYSSFSTIIDKPQA